jgi:ABC-type sugar transport system ATPase subunit
VKILAGVHQPDEGQLLIGGQPVVLAGPAAAQSAGIAVIYQEPTLFPDLTVAENIFMGRQPLLTARRIDRRRMRAQAAALFERLGVQLDPGRISRGLSIADQQIVEIAKALSREARVIVMDEPTAALSAAEVARLFDVVRALRAAGAAVLFISHRLEEVFEICQRVTVMRDGRQVLASELAGLTADDLVRAMVGREMPQRAAGDRSQPGQEVLRVEHLTREGVFTDISLRVRAGEIVALAGLVGSGRSEAARAIFGIDRYDAGAVAVSGKELRKASPAAAMTAGIGYVPEDRRQQGLVMEMSIQQNVALASLARLRHAGLIRSAAERAFATDWAQRLAAAQQAGDVLGAHAVFMDAYNTDVRPLLADLRADMDLDPTPSPPTTAPATPKRSSPTASAAPPPAGAARSAPRSIMARQPPEVGALLARSNRLGSDPRNTNYAGGNASVKAEADDPVTGRPVLLLWVKGSGGTWAPSPPTAWPCCGSTGCAR